MEKVNVIIDGKKLQVPKDYTVLQAAREAGIEIPTLCYLKGINEIGACRMCVVEIKGARTLQAACVYPVSEGIEVTTNSERVRKARKVNLELILSNHDRSCLTCVRSGNCELQRLSEDLNVKNIRFEGENVSRPIDYFSPSIVRDPNKCILCKRCVNVCKNVQQVGVINTNYRGFKSIVSTAFDKSLNEVSCTMCGQCIQACPVGALREKDSIDKVWEALNDKNKYVIVQTAPAVRVALGEEFGLPIGTRVTGKMVTALKMLGFDKVFDTDTGADLTIMEEGTELISRIKKGEKLPLITSCSPGWIKYCEHYFPEFLDNLSTCKSPHEMFGAILKSYFAQKINIEPEKVFVVSVMPCTAKKFEAQREELSATGFPDVDVVITTRELARMIKEAGIDFVNLKDSHFDHPMGDATGAGVIFGTTGGVMEAALRTVYEILTNKPLEKLEITQVRGLDGIREATIDVGEMKIKAAVAHGLANAKKLLEAIKNGEKQYHFVEIMACPGGCITGGGQPIVNSKLKEKINVAALRAKAIYDEDQSMQIRKSHENPTVKKLYEEFLGSPNSEKSHHLLHTHYKKRNLY